MKTERVRYVDSNRVGQFNITHEGLTNRPMCAALFALCTVLKELPHESGRGKTFIAASELFEPVLEGAEIPTYRIDFAANRPFEREDYEARRLNSGVFGFVAIRQNIVRVPPLQMKFNPGAIH